MVGVSVFYFIEFREFFQQGVRFGSGGKKKFKSEFKYKWCLNYLFVVVRICKLEIKFGEFFQCGVVGGERGMKVYVGGLRVVVIWRKWILVEFGIIL